MLIYYIIIDALKTKYKFLNLKIIFFKKNKTILKVC